MLLARHLPPLSLTYSTVVTKPDTSKSGIREETGPNLVRALGMFSDSHTRRRHILNTFRIIWRALARCLLPRDDRSQYCVRMRESPAIQVSGYVTLLWKLQVFTAFRLENASTSPFFAKDKSFPEKIRFSFGNYLNYYLQHLSFDVPAVIFHVPIFTAKSPPR